ncbi:MAG: hypothetical protein IIY55_12110 [Blautia sp.]|nr:hypothetical protein [Blautia sp.]
MNASSDHSVRCEGAIEILLPEEGYLSEYGGTAPGGSIRLDYIRGRGNSTWKYHEKKPYKIRLKTAAELEKTGVDYKDIYTWKTPRAIAARVSEKAEVDLDILNQAALKRDQFLTPYQTYFYDAVHYAPMQTEINNPVSLRFLRETVDPVRLKSALEAVFANYAVFSTILTHDDEGNPVMRHIPGKIVHPEIIEALNGCVRSLEKRLLLIIWDMYVLNPQ